MKLKLINKTKLYLFLCVVSSFFVLISCYDSFNKPLDVSTPPASQCQSYANRLCNICCQNSKVCSDTLVYVKNNPELLCSTGLNVNNKSFSNAATDFQIKSLFCSNSTCSTATETSSNPDSAINNNALYTLTVTTSKVGTATAGTEGRISSNLGTLECAVPLSPGATIPAASPKICTNQYINNSNITLTFTAGTTSGVVDGIVWEGCDTVDGTSCNVRMSSAKSVKAIVKQRYSMQIAHTVFAGAMSTAHLKSTPAGINSGDGLFIRLYYYCRLWYFFV